MPLYEYCCQNCSKEFELLVRGGESPTCPECGDARLERLLSVPAAHVGSGTLPVRAIPPGGPCGAGGCGRPECGP